MKRIVFITVLHIITYFLSGQTNYLYFDNYTTDNGLSDNYINCTAQDSKGWIWLGTATGIERFDGMKFKRYFLYEKDSISVKDFIVRNIYESGRDELFICTEDVGLAKYNREMDRFERLMLNGKPVLTNVSVKDLDEDQDKNLWAATKSGICKINFQKQQTTFFTHSESSNSISINYVRRVLFDKDQQLWIATKKGLNKFNPQTQEFIRFEERYDLLNDDILELYFDTDDLLWVGTANHSVVIVNTQTDSISQFIPDNHNDRCYKVNSITQNKNGKYWIGTRGGLYIFNAESNKIKWVKNDVINKNLLVHNSVLDIIFDAKGDAWISTRGGVSHMVQEKQVFEIYKALPGNNRYLNNNEIYCIWENNNGEIWIGTENGGVNILDRRKGTFKYLIESNGLSDNCVKAIQPLSNGKILIGTFQGGLNIYDPASNSIKWFKQDNNRKNRNSENVIWTIKTDNSNNVWIGTTSGLDRFIPETESFIHYPEFDDMVNGITWIGVDHDNDLWLGSEIIRIYRPRVGILKTYNEKSRELFIDSKGRYWIMSDERGIILFDKMKGSIKTYSEKEGLVCNSTFRMNEDNSGRLWISTAKGLSCFDPDGVTFQNFHSYNGLAGNQFNYGASFKSKSGELFFGGKDGLTIVNPDEIIQNEYIPPVYITDFKIFNKSVNISDKKNGILTKTISETDKIEIPYKYNVLSFEFAALNYSNSQLNRYKYKLEGFDTDWTEVSDKKSVTYTNLDPGEYTFHVLGSNDHGRWNTIGTSKKLVVLPPIYRKSWFIFLGLTLMLSLIFFIFLLIFKRRELAKTYKYEKEQAIKLHELDLFKLQLFTNISHEIKTPLSLIISPLKKIMKENIDNPEIEENLMLMEKHSQNLMNLINQLLDFRKLQDGKLILELKKGDIVRFCKTIFESFHSLMEEKGISYNFGSVQAKINANFDPDKLKKILNNLISNAIRYNKKGGNISLLISMVIEKSEEQSLNKNRYVKIVVEDTGVGIEEDIIANIFKRYYSKGSITEVNSTGIGLAFTKELIELHNGKISVQSKLGKGSVFTILLPFDELDLESPSEENSSDEIKAINFIKTEEFKKSQKDNSIMLIVEDNEDLLKFIKKHFQNKFLVLDTINGDNGLEIAYETIPDIIISDIMIPGIDGIELCNKIKTDQRTSHIPVILLSALDAKENVKKGLSMGADDYMIKPFDIDILESKIDNLLATRKSLMDNFKKHNILKPSDVSVKSLDEKFLEKAIKITEKHMADPDLNIDKFVEYMSISRMQLYRKFAALTNMTVKEFVNDLRLKRAEQIFSDKKISVSEVAYGVGFNDLSYFGRCFKRKYGLSPSEFNQKAMEKKGDQQPIISDDLI